MRFASCRAVFRVSLVVASRRVLQARATLVRPGPMIFIVFRRKDARAGQVLTTGRTIRGRRPLPSRHEHGPAGLSRRTFPGRPPFRTLLCRPGERAR